MGPGDPLVQVVTVAKVEVMYSAGELQCHIKNLESSWSYEGSGAGYSTELGPPVTGQQLYTPLLVHQAACDKDLPDQITGAQSLAER